MTCYMIVGVTPYAFSASSIFTCELTNFMIWWKFAKLSLHEKIVRTLLAA